MIKFKPMPVHTRQISIAVYFVFIYQFALNAVSYAQAPGLVAFNGDTEVGICLTASPDDKYLYSGGANTIAVFSHLPDGTLATQYVLNNFHGGIEGITYIVDITVSPDGRNLYAANLDLDKHTIMAFERDTATGAITLIDTIDFPSLDIYSFDPSHKLFASPDGHKLYWLFRDQRFYSKGAFMLFARDAATGRLTVLQTLQDNDSQLGGFKIPAALAATPDGKHIYGLGQNNERILVLAHDSTTGRIRFIDACKTAVQRNVYELNASVAFSPNGLFFYASFYDWQRKGALQVFTRNPVTGELNAMQTPASVTPGFVLPSPDGLHYYTSNYGKLFINKSDANGMLTPIGQFDCQCSGSAGNFAFSPNGETIYLPFGEGVIALDREVQSGMLATRQILRRNDLGGTDRLSGGRAVEVSPNGEHLYVGTDSDAAINVFARDQAQGRLALVEADSVGRISSMKVSPRGEHLYATTQKSELKTFSIDPASGSINLVQTLADTVRQYHTLAFSPDGLQLYLADFKRVKVFARDPVSGLLTSVQSFTRDGLRDTRILTLEVSPDGNNVYWQGNAFFREYRGLQVFTLQRNPTNGKLAFVDSLQLTLPNFDYVLGNRALQISPDGKHVYSGLTAVKIIDDGRDSNTDIVLGVFERDRKSGSLRLLETRTEVKWSYWDACVSLALSAEGKDLYGVLDSEGDINIGLVMLTRDVETGKLTQRDFFEVTKGGIGYDGPLTDAALSPDAGFLYFTDQLGVTTFATGRRITSRVGENGGFATLPPRALSLEQNYPNPFSSSTTHTSQRTTIIHYEIAAAHGNAQPVELTIYNTQGQLVRTLVNQTQTSGKHAATWNGENAQGRTVPSGVYFYRLKMGGQIITKKLLVVQ